MSYNFLKFTYFPYIILPVGCLLVYFPILSNDFLYFWDDQWVVMNRYTEGGFTLWNLWAILTEFYHGQYAPINELFYLILYSCFGYNAFCFHAASLLVHIANVLLVYVFIRELLLRCNVDQAAAFPVAFLTALLVAVHPFNVESVAWMSASKIILYVLFYMVALLCYLRYTGANRPVYYLLTLLFFIISFGAKEQAVTLPLCLLLVDFVLGRNLRSGQVWLEKLLFFVLALFFGMVTILSQGDWNGKVLSGNSFPMIQRIVYACYSYLEYLVKGILPVKLSYLYPFPSQPGESLPFRLWIYPLLLIILTVAFWRFWKRKWIFFGVVFFTIHIAVTLHIISLSRFAVIADRYVYLSLVGVCFVIAWLFQQAVVQNTKYRKAIIALLTLYVLYSGIYAHKRTYAWHDTDSLKREMREMIEQRNDYQELKKKLE